MLERLAIIPWISLALSTSACGSKSADTDDEALIGASVGGSQLHLELWARLGSYESSHLRTWKDALASPDPSTREVLDAFNELGYTITGPAGFWRKTVPNQWFGCDTDTTSVVCKTLAASSAGELKEWDAFQTEIAELPDGKEIAFLRKNLKRMMTYLDTWVPRTASMSDMQATGFYKEKLEKVMGATATTANDL
jgi:hypothetical protein